MKIYYDNLESTSSNLDHLTENNGNTFWIASKGTVVKQTLRELGYDYHQLSELDEPGCYFVDVNGDPHWWCGVLKYPGTPKHHIVDLLPENILDLVKNKKLRIVIAADKEGGSMLFDNQDCFEATYQAIKKQNLPAGSVLIIQGNKKIEDQYNEWMKLKNREKIFDVQHSCHFDKIFFNNELPTTPIIASSLQSAQFDFNSLNRVYRNHRGAHCFYLVKNNLLEKGLVSCSSLPQNDHLAAQWNDVSEKDFMQIMKENYPKHIDGDWQNINAANQYNVDIYKNSFLSFITETKFNEDVVFLTEKIFKPLAMGHPLICLASAGTLRGLADLGFKIDWCGIDPSYNDIVDDKERYTSTHRVLEDWISLPREKKINKILDSIETINYNFNLIRTRSYYKESLIRVIKSSEEYFND